MLYTKILKYLLYFTVALDIITIINPWIITSFFVIGIPGLLLTLWLLIMHIRTLKAVKIDAEIPRKYELKQALAGIFLIAYSMFCLMIFRSGSTSQTTFIKEIALLTVPSVLLLVGILVLMNQYNKQYLAKHSGSPTPPNV